MDPNFFLDLMKIRMDLQKSQVITSAMTLLECQQQGYKIKYEFGSKCLDFITLGND